MPGACKEGGGGGGGEMDGSSHVDMIGPAGTCTFGLHVTSTQAAVGREGRCKHSAV